MNLSALLALTLAATPGADDAHPVTVLQGRVVFESGAALQGVLVFCLDRDTDQVAATAVSDAQGRVALPVPGGHQVVLGAASARFEFRRLDAQEANHFRLTMSVAPHDPQPLGEAPAGAVGRITVAPLVPAPAGTVAVGAVRAAVVDETGTALAGVRVNLYGEGGALAATTLTDAAGHFLFVVPPGQYRLRPLASGLLPLRFETERERPRVVMGIDAQSENVQIVDGPHVLTFRVNDSIDPEYYPPPQVKAWLQQSYCLDVDRMFRRASVGRHAGPAPLRNRGIPRSFGGDEDPQAGRPGVPVSYAARQLHLEKYWWLKKLYTDPPGACHHHRRINRPLIPW
jgi:hypothetical protein